MRPLLPLPPLQLSPPATSLPSSSRAASPTPFLPRCCLAVAALPLLHCPSPVARRSSPVARCPSRHRPSPPVTGRPSPVARRPTHSIAASPAAALPSQPCRCRCLAVAATDSGGDKLPWQEGGRRSRGCPRSVERPAVVVEKAASRWRAQHKKGGGGAGQQRQRRG
jgi:hypothetical protein